ncbi:hypothetical protein ACP70R_035069 [Stipagrostis hirtigluma subsp. patula]
MSVHKCREKGIKEFGFLDPISINEKTVMEEPKNTEDALYKAMLAYQDKESVLLIYNFRAFGRYRKVCKKHRPFWGDFTVNKYDKCLRQPPSNDHCGFYAMRFMHNYTGDYTSATDFEASKIKRVELRTSELLLSDILSLQEELAGFILNEVVTEGGKYCVI